MPITLEQIEHAYELSKDVYDRRLTRSQAIDKLHTSHYLNKSTAKDFINQYEWMRLGQGVKFKRTMSCKALEYFLNHIESDKGEEALKVAIEAVKQHVTYYETKHGRLVGVSNLIKSIELRLEDSISTIKIIRSQFKISIRENNNQIVVEDKKVPSDKNEYICTNRLLDSDPEFVENFVDDCLNLGFTYALQHNHPRKDTEDVPYISFGRVYKSNSGASWDVALDQRSPNTFCIEARHENILNQANIPYKQESDLGKNLRIIPTHLKSALIAISLDTFDEEADAYFKEFKKEPPKELPIGNPKPQTIETSVNVYSRDPKVKAWVLYQADGKCECCLGDAPFKLPNGRPYLEVHHLIQLADSGADTVNNCIAICPNCHRKLHYGESRETLIKNIKSRIVRTNQ